MQKKQMTVEELEKALGYKVEVVDKQIVELGNVELGQSFNFCDTEFVALEHTNVGTYAITKGVIGNSIFDSSTNHYEHSVISRKIKDFERAFFDNCNEHNLKYEDIVIQRQMSLIALDGRKDYGSVNCYVGLMSLKQYQEYVYLLDNHQINDSWFLCSPASTENNGCSELVTCVNKKHYVEPASIRSTYGIRPMLMLKSDVMVEVVKKIF